MLFPPKYKLTSCTNDLFLPVANENATNVDPGTTCSKQKGKNMATSHISSRRHYISTRESAYHSV
jgi:hypothetical protein